MIMRRLRQLSLLLFSFLICILCHHRKHRLYFDTFIIPKK